MAFCLSHHAQERSSTDTMTTLASEAIWKEGEDGNWNGQRSIDGLTISIHRIVITARYTLTSWPSGPGLPCDPSYG
ncbi:hypothetical protein M404DRAFT_1007619 [Pisolithus tinctorius Marx 270]|uniref:Uncharacterized protein n=1 Tax=Pisolithus tinctorius Marx 270 TaxID=870435 RepID=A0A0C3NIX2_PISTI|nr:hypothetical protein M404DRAFT_1007619 [Pisolithus tinctorius Marx 270]